MPKIAEAEWDFEELPDQVDLGRIWHELAGHPAISVFAYINEFRKQAPKTYERYRVWCAGHGITHGMNL